MKKVLQKFIADSGYCSRRQAENLIREGRVFVNGQKAELGQKADENDEVRIDKKTIRPQSEKIYIALNKPEGYVCTNREFKNEKNIFDLVKVDKRLFAVGRLDKDSRGLVFLTNDGELTAQLTHPRYEHEKEYITKIKNQNAKIKMIEESFEKGIDIGEDDGIARVKEIKFLGDNTFKIILTEGKKRQIRRMFGRLDCDVLSLTRIRIASLELGTLKEGEWRYLSEKEIKKLVRR